MVAYDLNLDGTRMWGISQIAHGRDDGDCMEGGR